MQILGCFHVSKNDYVTVVDTRALTSVLVARLNNETRKFRALRIQLDHVARLVHLRTDFCSFKEALAVVVKQLNLIAVLNPFSLATIKDLFVCLDLLI